MRIWPGALIAAAAGTACMAGAAEPYDTIFRSGTLDALPVDSVIEYSETGGETDQVVRLTIGSDNRTELMRFQGDLHGAVGTFPTDVGNPLIMYFMENAVRAVAEQSGGSPFYIRNRFKQSLLEEAAREEVDVTFGGNEVSAERIVLHPLEEDEHAARAGFDGVAVEVTVSPDIPGWYYSLALTGGAGEAVVDQRVAIKSVEEAGQ